MLLPFGLCPEPFPGPANEPEGENPNRNQHGCTSSNLMKTKNILTILTAVVALVCASTGLAATVTTAGSGNWNSTTADAPWPGGTVPAAGSDIIIANGHTVTVTANVTANPATITINSGGQLTVGGFNLTVTGATTVDGTLLHNNSAGTHIYTGNVTINSGGVWNETAAAAISFGGNLQNDGSFTASTGTHTFTGTSKTFSGSITLPTVVLNGTRQNNGTLTVNTFNASGGTLTQGANSTLSYGGGSGTFDCTLDATATGNTVNYYLAGAQTVKATAYHHLTLSGSGAKTMSSVTTIAGNLTVSDSATMTGNAGFAVSGALNYGSSGSSTLTASTPISVGTFNQTAGTIVDNANTITVTGTGANTWTESGTFTTTGTVKFTGAAPEIGACAFSSLNIDVGGANTATLMGAVSVSGTLTLTSGALANGANLTLGNGAMILRAAGTLAAAPAFGTTVNVTYTSSTTVTPGPEIPASATILSTLTVNGTGEVTLNANLSINGNLAVTAGTLDLSTYTANRTAAGGTLSVGASGTLKIGGANTIPANYNTHTLTAGSTVEYSGTSQTISVESYTNLKTSGSGTKTLGGTMTVSGVLTVGSGTALDASTATLTLSGAGTPLVVNGTFTASASTVSYTSTSGATVAGGITYHNLTENGSSDTFTLNGNVTVNGTLTISSSDILNDGGYTLTVKGTISNSGTHSSTGSGKILFAGTSAQTFAGVFGNVELNNTAGASISAATIINGTLTATAGTFTAGAYALTVNGATTVTSTLAITSATGAKSFADITVNGTWNNSGNAAVAISGNLANTGTFTAGSGAYTLSGSGKTISGTLSIPSLTTTTGSKAISGALTVSTTLTLTSGGLAGAGNITLGNGATISRATGTLDAAPTFGTTVNLTYTASVTTGYEVPALPTFASVLNNFNVTGGTTTLGSAAKVNGNVDLATGSSSGTTLDTAGYDLTVVGNLATGNRTLTANGSTITIGGDFTGTGTFTPGTSTVIMNRAGDQSIRGGTFYNLSLAGSGTKTPSAAITVNSVFTIGSGTTFDVAGFTTHTVASGGSIVVNGTLDFTDAAGLIRSGTSGTTTLTMGSSGLIRTIDPLGLGPLASASLVTQTGGAWDTSSVSTAGTVEYSRNGTSGQTVTDRDYNNLTITGATQTKTWTIAATRTVNGNLTINASAPLTMSGAQILNVKGDWSNSGTFTAGVGTVSFNQSGTQSVGGSSTTTFNKVTVASGSLVAIAAVNANASELALNGVNQALGTWGATGSGAAHINDTFFSGTSGKLTVSRAATAIGTATSATSGTTIAVIVPAEGVAVNNTIIVAVAMDANTGSVSVNDTGGNSYTVDKDIASGTDNTAVRTLVFSAPVTTALVSGNTITVTMPTTVGKAVSASCFGGLVTATPVDQTASATGTSTSPSSGSTATTTQPDELVIGAIGVEETSTSATTLTPGSGYTALAQNGTASTIGVRILPEYKIVSALSIYAGNGTLNQSRDWAAAVVTYKVQAGELNAFRITPNGSPTAGSAYALTITAVDVNQNTVTSITGDRSFTFAGLAIADDGTYPTITDKTGAAVNLGTATTIAFASGVNSAGGSLKAYKAETAALTGSDATSGKGTGDTGGTGASLTIANVSPAGVADTVTRHTGTSMKILITSLLANDTDANHDTLTLTGVDASSTGGATLSFNSTYVFYVPNSAGNGDTFNYTISDGYGGTASGTVTVNVTPAYGTLEISYSGGGTVTLSFYGIPTVKYYIQRKCPGDTDFSDVYGPLTTPADGLIQQNDTPPESCNPALYRMRSE
jgi:hypothetical protein